MTQEVLKIQGLYTSANQMSSVPEGALSVADNIDILFENIASPRRGFERAVTNAFAANEDRANRIFFYQNYLFAHYGATAYAADKLAYYNSGWQSVSASISAPTDAKMQTILSGGNVFLTTSTGIKKLSAYNGSLSDAGVPKALNMKDVTLENAGTGWFASETGANFRVVAYRVVWGIEDANGNLVLGAPSGRFLVYGNDTAKNLSNPQFDIIIPEGITTSHFYQIYRSEVVTATDPSDEMQQVYEGFPTAGEISAKLISNFKDQTPEALRSTALYTNANQEGISAANEQPPIAKSMAVFRDSLFLANTTSKYRFYLTLLSASSLVVNDTITIGGIVYTCKSAENITNREFQKFTSGSASQNIEDTALSLVNVINASSSSVVNAYYLSSGTDLPGQILLEEEGIGGSVFAVSASNATPWSPSGLGNAEKDDSIHRIVWSKPFQPEHVPLTNNVTVGSAGSRILALQGLKDFLIIFKEDGIYKLTGYYPSFQIELLDSSAILIAPESVKVVNNEIYALTDLGVVRVSEGVSVVSGPINQEITQLINSLGSSVIEQRVFGESYEIDKKYYLFMPEFTADDYPTFAYVYNLLTNTWTKHIKSAVCSAIGNKTLYLAAGDANTIIKERKNYSFLDYVDYGVVSSITAINGLVITLGSSVDSVEAGDVIWQSNTIFGTVLSVNNINSTVTLDRDPGLTVASCEILKAISTKVAWSLMVAPTPHLSKSFHTALIHAQQAFNGTGYIGFSTDLSTFEEEVALTGVGNGNWGISVWGGAPWGSVPLSRSWRQWIPRGKQKASQMTVYFRHAWGYAPYKLTGVTLLSNAASEKTRRD